MQYSKNDNSTLSDFKPKAEIIYKANLNGVCIVYEVVELNSLQKFNIWSLTWTFEKY